MSKVKLIWAVDLYGEDASLQKKSAKMVNNLSATLNAEVVPTYVLSPIPFLFHPTMQVYDGRKYRAEKSNLKRKLEKWVKSFGVKSIDRCEILLSDEASVRSEAEKLIGFAEIENANLIIVSTHSRKGLDRFFLGSFAETLLLRSPIPLMLVQPKTDLVTPLKNIVFPTDFSDKSKSALIKVEAFAKASGACIQLFHHMEYLTPSFRDMAVPTTRIQKLIKEMSGEMTREKRALGKAWISEIKKNGVTAKFTLSEKPIYAVDAILAFSKKFKTGVVAIASQTKPGLAEMIGGIARRVVRQAPIPIWVVHPIEVVQTKFSPLIGQNKEKGARA